MDRFNAGRDVVDEHGQLVHRLRRPALGGKAHGADKQRLTHLEHLADAHPDVGEPDAHGRHHGLAVGRGDDEATAWSPAHARRTRVLDDADGLSKHGSADAELLEEVGLRAEHGPDRPSHTPPPPPRCAARRSPRASGRRACTPDAHVCDRHGSAQPHRRARDTRRSGT